MAERFTTRDSKECWNFLTLVLSYGHTIPFAYKKDKQKYRLEGQYGFYSDESSEEYLLEDIHFALFEENLEKITLVLSGKEDGPICNFWKFTFTKKGLTEAYSFYNDD